MNKTHFYALIAVSMIFGLGACKKNNFVRGKVITPPAFVKIGTWNEGDTSATYVIPANNKPFMIPIGITNVSDKDRTIQFSYTSATATKGLQFNAPESITIKAGKALDSLPISGLYQGYSSVTRVDKLIITITGGDVPLSGSKTHYVLFMKKYWEAPADAFSGIYTIQDYTGGDPDGGPYQVIINPTAANGPITEIEIIGLWGKETPLKVTLNWIDLEHGATATPKQLWAPELFGYGQATIREGEGEFTVSNPHQISIGYTMTVAAGSFGSYTSVMTK